MNTRLTLIVWVAVVSYLAGEVTRWQVLTATAATLFALALLLTVNSWISKRSGKLAFAVASLSLVLLAAHGQLVEALGKTGSYIGVVVLLLCVSLIRLPVKEMALEQAVHGMLSTVRRRYRLATIMVSSTLLAPLLNLGTVALLGALLRNKSNPAICVPRAVTRGVGAAMLWSPTFAPTALIMMQFPNVGWTQTLPVAIPLFLLALLLGARTRGEVDVQVRDEDSREWGTTIKKAAGLIGMIAGGMITARSWLGFSITSAVSVGGILGVFCWFLIFGERLRDGKIKALGAHTESTWIQVSAEAALFLASGLLASVLQDPYWAQAMEPLTIWLNTSSWISWGAIMLGVPLLTILGIHPVVPYTVLVHQVTAAGLGVDQAVLYMVWAVVWMLSLLLSPVSALNLSAAMSFGVSPWRVGVAANWSYGLLFGISSMVILHQWG